MPRGKGEISMSKITVIGAGSVGATIANDLMIQGTATEILLIDINREKAFGEALDIYQGAPFCSPAIYFVRRDHIRKPPCIPRRVALVIIINRIVSRTHNDISSVCRHHRRIGNIITQLCVDPHRCRAVKAEYPLRCLIIQQSVRYAQRAVTALLNASQLYGA